MRASERPDPALDPLAAASASTSRDAAAARASAVVAPTSAVRSSRDAEILRSLARRIDDNDAGA
ncbi:MAG: hypothetical protein ACODAE_07805, partial [Gemmatimonadota bacterium]